MTFTESAMPTLSALSKLCAQSAPRPQPSKLPAFQHSRSPHLAKYIIIDLAGDEYAICFPQALQHSEMLPAKARPVSAGFYQIIDADTLLAGGDSVSLNLSSRPEKDAALLRKLLTSTDN